MAGPFKMKGWSPFHQEKVKAKRLVKKEGRAITEFKRHGFEIGEEKHAFRSDLTFGQAFNVARRAGAKTFWWKGEEKTTELAE